MQFEVDSRILTSSCWLADWALSSVYLKNDANFPWLILVPREDNIQEIYQLSAAHRHTLMDEIAAVSKIMENFFKPDKLNVGALGNIVAQLHVHVVARFKTDKMWPHGIWQPKLKAVPYGEDKLADLVSALRKEMA
jgi:diadenosine tetraphosphate (Ap4A) HIT family hydrolase